MRPAAPSTRSEPAWVRRVTGEVDPRLLRLRRLAWLLDRSIPIGGGYRIGIDPLIGLIPGIGDVVGAGLSSLILHDAARLGLPVHVLLRMIGNVVVELVIGVIPVVGDLFDFAWHANMRNLALVERHYDPLRAERPTKRIVWAIGVGAVLAVVGLMALGIVVLQALWQAIDRGG